MASIMKTLLLNPPSFGSSTAAPARDGRRPARSSLLVSVWLTYPAGMLPGSRLLDAPPHKITPQQTVEISKDYEFLVLFTSTVGFDSDLQLARKMKEVNPSLKIAFVGPHVQIKPDQSLRASTDIDFIVRGEFDHAVVEFANGRPLSEIANVTYLKDGKTVHNATRPPLNTAELDELPFDRRLQARSDDRELQHTVSA